MIELKVTKDVCIGKFEGKGFEVTAESIIVFIELCEAVSKVKEISFDSAALLIYQNGLMAHKEVKKENLDEVSD